MGQHPQRADKNAQRTKIGAYIMTAIHDLINQIQDPALRAKIEQEVEKLTKQ